MTNYSRVQVCGSLLEHAAAVFHHDLLHLDIRDPLEQSRFSEVETLPTEPFECAIVYRVSLAVDCQGHII